MYENASKITLNAGAGENTLRRLALFLCLDHPTKSDVTSDKKAGEPQNKI